MDNAVPSEMDIVDTFTHLIFFGAEELSPEENSILEALQLVDRNAARVASDATPGNVGAYLRALGVREMTQLVARVRDYYLQHPQQPPPRAQTRSPAARRPLSRP